MTPSRAMGTFLKVWRSEWAGLSRAQLALAVSARMTNGKRLKPSVIYWWEEGQPPSTTEELEALLQVMRTHGLTMWEVDDFRRAVLAACSNRQYPELFPDDNFAFRDDVDQMAHLLHDHEMHHNRSTSTVCLVVWMQELHEAVFGQVQPRGGRAQQARQEQALASIQEALGHRHGASDRTGAAAATWAWNEDFTRQRQDRFDRSRVTFARMNRVQTLEAPVLGRGDLGEVRAWVARMRSVAAEADALGGTYAAA